MRVTERAIFDRAIQYNGSARERLEQSTADMSTGYRFVHPGQDPVGTTQALMLGHEVDQNDSQSKALARAGEEIDTADQAMAAVVSALDRINVITVQMASDTVNASDRATAAIEVEGLFQSMVQSLNLQVGGRYIFGGTADREPPFSSAGAYLGNDDARVMEIAPGMQQEVSIRANEFIGGATSGDDVFATVQTVVAALKSNNGDGLRALQSRVGHAHAQVVAGRARAGAISQMLQAASTARELVRDDATLRRSKVTDVDAIDGATRLALAQRALEASISATSQSFRLSLLQKL